MVHRPSDWATDEVRDRQLDDLANWSHQIIELTLSAHTADALAAQLWSDEDTELLRAKLMRLRDCANKARAARIPHG